MIRRRDTIPQELGEPDPDIFEEEEEIAIAPASVQVTPLHHFLPQEARNMLAGGLAGMMAKTAVAPLDRIKILYQVSSLPYNGMREIPGVARNIIQREGVTALWKGHGVMLMRVFPYSGIQFMVYDRLKSFFLHAKQQEQQQQRRPGLTPMESLVAGMTAGIFSVIFTYPLDLTRAQLAVLLKHKHSKNATVWQVLSDNYTRNSAGIPGLFRGMTPTILGILPYAGIAFAINEQTKKEIQHVMGRDVTTIERMICGALAGLVAQTATYPMEMIRRRMQTVSILEVGQHGGGPGGGTVDTALGNLGNGSSSTHPTSSSSTILRQLANPTTTTASSSSPPRISMAQMVRTLHQQHGIAGFFKGVSMNWIKGPVAFAISFTAYDTIQRAMLTPQERQARLPLRRRLTSIATAGTRGGSSAGGNSRTPP